jgi:hypothetical protein
MRKGKSKSSVDVEPGDKDVWRDISKGKIWAKESTVLKILRF